MSTSRDRGGLRRPLRGAVRNKKTENPNRQTQHHPGLPLRPLLTAATLASHHSGDSTRGHLYLGRKGTSLLWVDTSRSGGASRAAAGLRGACTATAVRQDQPDREPRNEACPALDVPGLGCPADTGPAAGGQPVESAAGNGLAGTTVVELSHSADVQVRQVAAEVRLRRQAAAEVGQCRQAIGAAKKRRLCPASSTAAAPPAA